MLILTHPGPGRAADQPFAANTLALPAALAADAGGNVYVADVAAQRIARVAIDGTITTLAGLSQPAPGDLFAYGGYADGPAAMARFRHPGGLAVARDGSVYVADTYNHCIRKIAGGTVSTFAGNATQSGTADGPLAAARFQFPRALAFDAAGDLFVADFTVGLREIARDGNVTTLHVPALGNDVTSMSAFDAPGGTQLYLSDDLRTIEYDLSTKHVDLWGVPPPGPLDGLVHVHALEAERLPGKMSSIVGLGMQTFAYVDALEGTAKIVVRDALGSLTRIPLSSPLGITRAGSELAISDSLQHRIIRVPVPDLRTYSDSVPAAETRDAFRVAVLSDSFSFFDTLWTDSIPGVLEERLRASAKAAGAKRTVQTLAVRFSSVDALRSYVNENLEPGQVDAIVLLVNSPFVYVPLYGGNDWGSDLSRSPERWRSQLIAQLTAFRQAAAAKHLPLFVAVHPLAIELAPGENLDAREASSGGVSSEEGLESYAALVAAVRAAGMNDALDLGPDLAADERTPGHLPLYGNYDFHFNAAGRAFVAERLARWIETSALWRAAH